MKTQNCKKCCNVFQKPGNEKCRSAESTVTYCKNAISALTFASVSQFSSMKTRRMRSSSMQHVGSFMGPNRRTLFRRCNKAASERKGQWNPYTRGSENLPKKVWKKAFRRAWVVYNAIVGQLFRHFRKIAKTCSERKDILYPYTRGSDYQPGDHPYDHPDDRPGRSKSTLVKRILRGRKSPSDAWPGPTFWYSFWYSVVAYASAYKILV